MVSVDEAYEVFIQMNNDPPLMDLSEGPHYFKSEIYIPEKGVAVIRKDTGKIEYRKPPASCDILLCDNFPEKIIYFPRMYDDLVEYYQENKSERILARLYQRAFFEKSEDTYDGFDEKMYRSRDDYDQIKRRWDSIEQFLYAEIRRILDNEEIEYPQCVLNRWDDPFYRIKPFMVRNGYTDSSTRRAWEKCKH